MVTQSDARTSIRNKYAFYIANQSQANKIAHLGRQICIRRVRKGPISFSCKQWTSSRGFGNKLHKRCSFFPGTSWWGPLFTVELSIKYRNWSILTNLFPDRKQTAEIAQLGAERQTDDVKASVSIAESLHELQIIAVLGNVYFYPMFFFLRTKMFSLHGLTKLKAFTRSKWRYVHRSNRNRDKPLPPYERDQMYYRRRKQLFPGYREF